MVDPDDLEVAGAAGVGEGDAQDGAVRQSGGTLAAGVLLRSP